MEREQNELINRGLNDPDSPIYMSNNALYIQKFLHRLGFSVSLDAIKTVLKKRKTGVLYDVRHGERKISEVSKSYAWRGAYWSHMHGDLAVLSRKQNYHFKYKYVLNLRFRYLIWNLKVQF